VDLAYDAELLEKSTKRNDKYTVRRILDVHYSYFRIKEHSLNDSNDVDRRFSVAPIYHSYHNYNMNSKNNTNNTNYVKNGSFETESRRESQSNLSFKKKCVPSIFFNILHLAIENNSLDVLRISLKYGLDPNESGTTQPKLFIENRHSLINSSSCIGKARFPIKCVLCAKTLNDREEFKLDDNSKSSIKRLQEIIHENEHKEEDKNEAAKKEKIEPEAAVDLSNQDAQSTNQIVINYSSFLYLVRLPPLFLSISKCNHAATELLLSFGACPNVQDTLGNTPLHLAVAKRQPCYECIFLLLKYHASSLVFNNKLQSPSFLIDIVLKKTALNSPLVNSQNNDMMNHNDHVQTNDSKNGWNYNLNSVHSAIISELFTNGLTKVTQEANEKSLDNNSNNNQTADNINNISKSLSKVNTLKNTKAHESTSSLINTKLNQINQSNNSADTKFTKSFTLHNSNAITKRIVPLSHSLKNMSKIKNSNHSTSSNSLLINDQLINKPKTTVYDDGDGSKQQQQRSAGINRNNSSQSETPENNNKIVKNKPASKIEKSNLLTAVADINATCKSKSLTSVETASTKAAFSSLDKNEKKIIQKYARCTKAINRPPSQLDFFHNNRQISLTNVNLINNTNNTNKKCSSSKPHNSMISRTLSRKQLQQTNESSSLDNDAYNSKNLINYNVNNNVNSNQCDNSSMVSSKISLFKKAVFLNNYY
jgi:hypothetical protein